ncbi:MAG: hypothetical protein JRI39_04270 [Deltaproteobacteria bacterium]|nr:hypothetical protein [Deltaproteobacteria bacterium]MBW2082306.1 hypothetical protein [Deltaproteobacteria bacterium]HDM10217.1 hypothetical protein [Desulfobacteraceae bacterium]
MSQVIEFEKARLNVAAKRGYRNWISTFEEKFSSETKLSDLSVTTLAYLAQAQDKSTFYLYDLIMSLEGLGSGFEFNELPGDKKMSVIDRYLFILDRIRFECMKRLGWLDSYPGEDLTIVEMIARFEEIAPALHARIPVLSKDHPAYESYSSLNSFEQETFIRKLIPKALRKIQDYSTTL